jgi:hypothetical protein
LKKIEFAAPVHLTLYELEARDLSLGLTVRPGRAFERALMRIGRTSRSGQKMVMGAASGAQARKLRTHPLGNQSAAFEAVLVGEFEMYAAIDPAAAGLLGGLGEAREAARDAGYGRIGRGCAGCESVVLAELGGEDGGCCAANLDDDSQQRGRQLMVNAPRPKPPLEDALNEKEVFASEVVSVGGIHGNIAIALANVRFDEPLGRNPGKQRRVVVARLMLTNVAASQLLRSLQRLAVQIEATAAAASGKQPN